MEYSTRDPVLTTEETETTPSERVVKAIAEAEDADPLELQPLYSAVDPDALDAIITSQQQSTLIAQPSAEIRFDYHGYWVTVSGDGRINIDSQ